ncbi:MAG: cobalt ECF transporter T component CbiQ [Methanobacteriaceae archaeon]|nr:cobalt ECF transporter T component CbiQ [Methanobacteriaceae archaeon]
MVIICVALACLSPFIASSNPDGLEKSFEDANVSDEGISAVVESPFPDYTFEPLSQFGEIGVLILGALIVAILGFLVSIILKKKDNDENSKDNINKNNQNKKSNHSHGIGQVLNLESVASGDSPIHKLDGRIKLISVLILIVFCVFSKQLIVPIILEIYLIILMYISDIPMKQSFKRVALLLPFGGFIIIFQPFIHPGHIIWASGISWINITDTGLNWAIILLARLIVCLTAIVLLSSTSPMQEIVQSFRKLGLPKDFAMILSIMVRFLFIFVDELEAIRKAQKSRNFNIHNKALPYKWRLRQVGYTVAMMFLKAYEKGEKVYLSMTSRCFSDKSDMYNTKTKLDSSDYAYLIAIIVIVIGLELIVLSLAPQLGYFGLALTL